MSQWIYLGNTSELKKKPLQEVTVDGKLLALSFHEGKFGAVSGTCLHIGGPLGQGEINRSPGPIRVVGISTTVLNKEHPRVSTSDLILEEALAEARKSGAEAKLIKLNDLKFRACEGIIPEAPKPAPGLARLRKWIPQMSSTKFTKRSFSGRMWCSYQRRSAALIQRNNF